MKLAGRNAVITGGTTGLGYAMASAFLAEGANVAICGRDPSGVVEAKTRLQNAAREHQRLLAFPCDVSSKEEVDSFICRALNELGNIQILVNNAGILGPVGKTEEVDLSGWLKTIETNLYSVLFTAQALLPHMRSQGYGKLVNLSGGGATAPRPFFSAYAASKAAVVRLTETLAGELRGTGIDVNAMAPGALNTRLLEQTLAFGPEKVGREFPQLLRQQKTGGASIERAADLCVYLASAASDGITGRLISAPWDPWPALHGRLEELESTDIYTLRRIVPEDRAKSWN